MVIHRLRGVENAMHLFTNEIPQLIFAELMIRRNSSKLHEAPVGLRPSGRDEHFLRRPVYKLRTATTGAETSVVQVSLEPGDVVGRGLHIGNARGYAVVLPETVYVGVGIAVVGARRTSLLSLGAVDALGVECFSQDKFLQVIHRVGCLTFEG